LKFLNKSINFQILLAAIFITTLKRSNCSGIKVFIKAPTVPQEWEICTVKFNKKYLNGLDVHLLEIQIYAVKQLTLQISQYKESERTLLQIKNKKSFK
jgi:hypothetical protein